ncbi:hypothetical protein EOPP23_18240 [Endozoicomonas sp. OPT23]|uniref:hypothetical protein n=1 Tax=Endozoicomonas sp. OPT23 TaxID=2072845 RepID=UPI0018912132|nr:hypothetical protein [Endozoicomonas sp. OPT23]MRI34918.1 hypothetical protein [Endozoicomonas sp. OPT23]
MNLTNSIITSAAIVLSAWSLVMFQPIPSNAMDLTEASEAAAPPAFKLFTAHSITGVTQKTALNSVNLIWDKFSRDSKLQGKLKKQPVTIFVLYRNISKNFQSADITIGFDSRDLTDQMRPVSLASPSDYEVLLPTGKHSSNSITDAWNKLNYQKDIQSVLEIHTLDKESQPLDVQVLVNYQ